MLSLRSSVCAVPRTVRWVVCALGLWLAAAPGWALEMVELSADGIGRVLLLRDCEPRSGKKCAEHEGSVFIGDAQRLEGALSRARYAEVWLHSTGGHSIEGPLLGHVLRRHGMAVRVRQGHSCASACTVAFLGGVIRTIDPGAEYHVHAPSGVRNRVDEDTMRRLLAAPDSQLEREVQLLHDKARKTVIDRLQYVQQMLGGRPEAAAYRALQTGAQAARPSYLSSPQLAADVARIRTEGPAAVHTTVMTHERSAYDEVLAYVRPHVAGLGPRAAAAHRMVEAMFSTTTIRTADLTPEVLVKLGFVTPVLGQ
jgi:hypothetical protein